jgi:ribonuclease P protein component
LRVGAESGNEFPKALRLRAASEFQCVYERGARKVSRSFVAFVLPNELGYTRFGFTTPRKLAKAHDRNRIRRRIREILRTARREVPAGFDVVINPRRSAGERKFDELRTELINLLGGES